MNGRIIKTFLSLSNTVCIVNISATIVFPENKKQLFQTKETTLRKPQLIFIRQHQQNVIFLIKKKN